MKVALITLTVASTLLLSTLPADAHHSFGGTYNVDKQITIKGKMVQVSLRSPHSFFFVEAADEGGKLQRWSIEGAGAAQFAQQGVNKDAFRILRSTETDDLDRVSVLGVSFHSGSSVCPRA